MSVSLLGRSVSFQRPLHPLPGGRAGGGRISCPANFPACSNYVHRPKSVTAGVAATPPFHACMEIIKIKWPITNDCCKLTGRARGGRLSLRKGLEEGTRGERAGEFQTTSDGHLGTT